MSMITRSAQFAVAAAAGVAGEYFLDPDSGKRRRHIARDRALAMVRRPARKAASSAQKAASHATGVARGVIHGATTQDDQRDPGRLNDQGLEAKVESEVFRSPDSPKNAVNLNVEAGVVYLRGELSSREEIERLVESVRAVDGVGSVRSLLHLPGEQPPAKEEAQASDA